MLWPLIGGRIVRWRWIIWIKVGQAPTTFAVVAGESCLDIFLSSIIFFLSPSLRDRARFRVKYCLKGQLSPKQTTNQPLIKTVTTRLSMRDHTMFLWMDGQLAILRPFQQYFSHSGTICG